MGYSAVAFMQCLPFLLTHNTAVGHYRPFVDEAEMSVDLSVVGLVREQLCYPVNLTLNFIEMGMHIHTLVDVALV